VTPDKDRKAQERQRYRDAGLVPIEVWVRPADKVRVRRYVERLQPLPAKRANG
jgi:hypothetical protein